MQPLSINNQEESSIALYIKKHDTAVLTVMFTDIQGFTDITEEIGDELAVELRSKHDKILTDIIQDNDAGLVIKFIGDAVMAVFAEPSAAIDKSVKIQNAIAKFNLQDNNLPAIKVRIGLHMGQVTVEDTIELDIFGRHVNRAARIESLAQGGQILMSYSVYDSAQGWVVAQKNIDSQDHGRYELKGIDGAVQVFEVYDPKLTSPVTPTKGKVKESSNKKSVLMAAISAVFAVAILLTFQWYKHVELRLESFYPQDMRLADNTKIALAGNKEDASRLVENELEPGKHLIYYTVGKNLRYYTELVLERGLNQVKPKFKEWRLPSLHYRISDNKTKSTPYTRSKEFIFYSINNQLMSENSAKLSIEVERKVENNQINNTVLLTIEHEGNLIANEEIFVTQLLNSKIERQPKKTIWQSDLFNYELKLYTGRGAIDISIMGNFN
ncbi:adenylate/guanylate cyclase domain-containing protein [Psychromonas ossibalaenae]|uniref:adenylate/guanylate cyclase domain-containing protein n=1 Tax=Psychromonas ossibalaenae TaxID=444922 RepID=UPI0003753B47|nr:adenylate/guanylate cyclase domain-containing protein [Psychromonas ossibalaenae]